VRYHVLKNQPELIVAKLVVAGQFLVTESKLINIAIELYPSDFLPRITSFLSYFSFHFQALPPSLLLIYLV